VVRIAVHPELSGAGYGSRCVELLRRYFQGEITGEPPQGIAPQESINRMSWGGG
jgi:tRNA(Met) C34 N-acetyltransferase TmcA